MKHKLSPWHSADTKPVHVGVYQRLYSSQIFYCLWNGRRWNFPMLTANEAAREKAKSYSTDKQWRGIVK